jgi:hypothetical protein
MVESLNLPPDLVQIIRNMYIESKGIIQGNKLHEYY